jgi:hypothetical protein
MITVEISEQQSDSREHMSLQLDTLEEAEIIINM